MRALRYRVGTNRKTGELLVGWPHCAQSLEDIWTTRRLERVMRLDYGSDVRGHLGEDITPELALALYADLVEAAHAWEPEYRVTSMQLVTLTRPGGLGLSHKGVYYPEGRFGNYAASEQAGALVPLPLIEQRRAA